jgi:hypothetical protein
VAMDVPAVESPNTTMAMMAISVPGMPGGGLQTGGRRGGGQHEQHADAGQGEVVPTHHAHCRADDERAEEPEMAASAASRHNRIAACRRGWY